MADEDFMSVEFNRLHTRVEELDAKYFAWDTAPKRELVHRLQEIDCIVQRLLAEVAHG